jgi:hypothetical protein
MGKRQATAVAGFGIALLMWVLEMSGITIPIPLLISLGVIAVAMIIYGSIPIVLPAIGKIRKLRVYIAFDGQQKGEITNTEFSVKLETISVRSTHSMSNNSHRISRIVSDISFRTNKPIQIASIHLKIDSTDPRDIIEPNPELVQGFSLPYMLERSETHQFQFDLLPEKVEGKSLLLSVLAGGHWYTDGPYKLKE